ncbi:hypothetical protein [Streptomyces sp. NPDC059631]|uniref:hypothetical protein n=1 Tax=unclassified Streptomyces TaxID=2593676 RepID=UPI0036C89642
MSRRLLAGAAGVALASGVLLSGGTAQAATASIGAGRVQLCAQGNYAAYLVFNTASHSLGGQLSGTVAAGTCQTFNVPNFGGGQQTNIAVRGKFNTSNNTFAVDDLNVPPTAGGWKLFARGTTGNAGADAYLVIEAGPRS